MKRKIYLLTIFFTLGIALGFVGVSKVGAVNLNQQVQTVCNNADAAAQATDICTSNADNRLYGSNGAINKVTLIIALVAGVTAIIIIIYGGFQYILSSGDPQKATKAKNMILFATIGLVVIALAETIVRVVIGNLK